MHGNIELCISAWQWDATEICRIKLLVKINHSGISSSKSFRTCKNSLIIIRRFACIYVHVLQICHIVIIYRVDMFVHQKWVEPRLILHDDIFEEGDDYVTLPPEFFDNLWQPDPYFLNSKVAGKSLSKFIYPTLNSIHFMCITVLVGSVFSGNS